MKQIYIMLTYSGTLLSKAISIYTKEPYSHVSVALDDNLEDLYSFGRLRPRNPLFAGFVKEDIENGTYARFPKTRCAIYALDVSFEQYENLYREIEKFEVNKNRYRYNLLGLIGVMVNRPIEREYSYFCSQFVSKVLKNSGIELINKPTGLIEPSDFRTCKDLRLVYEGDLRTYGLREAYV